jgi:RNA polymerase sigma-70 factor (ECF subfamily)
MGRAETSDMDFKQAALEHIDALYGFAMMLSRDPTEAQDLVQETYLRAVRAFDTLAAGSNLKSWLFTIMRNVWLNHLRHLRSGPRFIEIDKQEEGRVQWFGPGPADPYAMLVRKLEREEVRRAIESLPGPYREVVVLRDIEGFSYQQIAGVLGCPAGTVMSRLGRARERLRQSLNRRQPETAGGALRAKEA